MNMLNLIKQNSLCLFVHLMHGGCCHTLVLLFGSHEDDEDDFELANVGWYIWYFFVSI